MRHDYWFKLTNSGLRLPAGKQGWVPDSFEGYMITYLYIALQMGLTIIFILRLGSPIIPQLTSVIMYLFLSGVLLTSLVSVCLIKGEKPDWPWEKKK